jgi:hypothetical protein
LTSHPLIAVEAALLAAASVALPAVRARGAWEAAALGAWVLGLGLVVPLFFGAGMPAALPFVLGVGALYAVLVFEARRRRTQVEQ